MKAASGEVNLTVITLIAIALVAGFFTTYLWPKVQKSINESWGQIEKGGKDNDYSGYTPEG